MGSGESMAGAIKSGSGGVGTARLERRRCGARTGEKEGSAKEQSCGSAR